MFNILETEKEGILGATKLYPGVITEGFFIIHYKSILEMFAEEHHAAMTDAIANCFIEITTLTVSKQCILSGKALCDVLQDASTAGGGKANLPSYATECVKYTTDRVCFQLARGV